MKKLSNSFSGALRKFVYFMASGNHYLLKGVNYISLYGTHPSVIEQAFAIFANNIEMSDDGEVLNVEHAEKRATGYIRSFLDNNYVVNPKFEDWEVELY
jgi:hypothetical protein